MALASRRCCSLRCELSQRAPAPPALLLVLGTELPLRWAPVALLLQVQWEALADHPLGLQLHQHLLLDLLGLEPRLSSAPVQPGSVSPVPALQAQVLLQMQAGRGLGRLKAAQAAPVPLRRRICLGQTCSST